MAIQIENLRAYMRGIPTNSYQRALAVREFDKLLEDYERLNKLQELTTGYGHGWVLRESSTGRGLRLHESSHIDAVPDIRQAIDNFIK